MSRGLADLNQVQAVRLGDVDSLLQTITPASSPFYEFREALGQYYSILSPLVLATFARAASVDSFCSLGHHVE